VNFGPGVDKYDACSGGWKKISAKGGFRLIGDMHVEDSVPGLWTCKIEIFV
jgi:hypothetical protein